MKKILCLIPLLFFIQPAFAEIVIQNDQPYIGDDSVLHIVGEIQNNSKNPLFDKLHINHSSDSFYN